MGRMNLGFCIPESLHTASTRNSCNSCAKLLKDWLDFCRLLERFLASGPESKRRSLRKDAARVEALGLTYHGKSVNKAMMHTMAIVLEVFDEPCEALLRAQANIHGPELLG